MSDKIVGYHKTCNKGCKKLHPDNRVDSVKNEQLSEAFEAPKEMYERGMDACPNSQASINVWTRMSKRVRRRLTKSGKTVVDALDRADRVFMS